MKKYSLLYILPLLLLNACADVPANTTAETMPSAFCLNDELKKTTTLYPVKLLPVTEQITLSGKIEYNENDLVAFRSLLEGIVEKVNFELGDYVRRGQVLITVKSNQVLELYQQMNVNANQVDLLQKQVQTKKELLADGMISAPEVIELEHTLINAKNELDRIRKTLQLFKAGGDGNYQIIAPKDGYIIQKSVSPGQTITDDSEVLFSISNLNQVWAMVNIYANNLKFVKTGDRVRVRTIAYPDVLYNGVIDKVYNVFDDNEHVLKARVVLENKNLNLLPGLAADIIIDKGSSSGTAYAIPSDAKIFYNNKNYVVVYRNDCDLEVRKVTIVAQNEEHIYVKEVFAENEQVIVKNGLILFEQLNH